MRASETYRAARRNDAKARGFIWRRLSMVDMGRNARGDIQAPLVRPQFAREKRDDKEIRI